MTHRPLLCDFVRSVWEANDPDAVDRFFVEDGQASGLVSDLSLGPADLKVYAQGIVFLVRDVAVSIPHVVEAGDWISAVIEMRCTSRRDGAPVRMTGQITARVEDGLFAEVFNHFDLLGALQQLGLLPGDVVEAALMGEGLS